MSDMKIIKPKEGLKVFYPKLNRYLKENGEEVFIDRYWRRMIKCGDASIVDDQKKMIEEKDQTVENNRVIKNKKTQKPGGN